MYGIPSGPGLESFANLAAVKMWSGVTWTSKVGRRGGTRRVHQDLSVHRGALAQARWARSSPWVPRADRWVERWDADSAPSSEWSYGP